MNLGWNVPHTNPLSFAFLGLCFVLVKVVIISGTDIEIFQCWTKLTAASITIFDHNSYCYVRSEKLLSLSVPLYSYE
jgi:hypothetical protein